MNIDKTIKELSNRLDEIHPYSAPTNNHQNRNDGINYWKGKKIIPAKDWNDLYKKSSTYTDDYKITLTSKKPLQYFPDDYNGSISLSRVINDELKEAAEKWNKDFYELLEYRKNPTFGRMKCTKCLLSGSNDDPIFIGIEKVFARIVSNQCNKNISLITNSNGLITYHCNVMNIFSCPFESKEEPYNNSIDGKDEKAKYPYKREDLFALDQISFAIEQAISTFFEITKNNEIIFEVDFENDRVQEIHTKYNGEPESWGWQENVKEQLSKKVKPISNIVIRDEQDIYNILTSGEKLESLFQEYEKKHQLEKNKQELENAIYNKNLKLELTIQLKEELKKHEQEQLRLLKENKQTIVKFLLENKDSIIMEDLKAYEPIYECYLEKGHCFYCNTTTNIICKNCSNYNYNNNKEIWLCINHWQQHAIENH
jgi:hypothetical protein